MRLKLSLAFHLGPVFLWLYFVSAFCGFWRSVVSVQFMQVFGCGLTRPCRGTLVLSGDTGIFPFLLVPLTDSVRVFSNLRILCRKKLRQAGQNIRTLEVRRRVNAIMYFVSAVFVSILPFFVARNFENTL